MVINIAQDHCNDKCYLMREVVNHALSVLDYADWLDMQVVLIKPTKPSKKLQAWLREAFGDCEAETALQARVNEFDLVSKGDVVAIKQLGHSRWEAAKVLFFVACNGVNFAAVRRCTMLNKDTTWSTWWMLDEYDVEALDNILGSMHYTEQDDILTVLHLCGLC